MKKLIVFPTKDEGQQEKNYEYNRMPYLKLKFNIIKL
jgi:hypothetical protein